MAAIALRLRCEVLESRRLMAADLGDPLSIAVESSAMDGLRAAEIQLNYDPRSLNIEAADIRPGAAWKEQASLVSNVDADTGSVRIFLFSVEPIDTPRGKLVDLHFEVNEGSTIDSSSVALSHMRLNEGELESSAALTEMDAKAVDKNVTDDNQAPLETNIDATAEATIEGDTSAINDKACSPWDWSASEPESAPQADLSQWAAPLVKLEKLNLFD